MTSNTIYWYDFETFGSDPRRDRAAQFAGLRTDEALNEVTNEQPLVLYCRPADDFLPDPGACLITGITPARAEAEGKTEAEFIGYIHRQFSTPGTCVAGYNNIRFDDELSRQLLYRNFYDPYEREWRGGNSRWDILDMMRLCAATRPQGIEWPLEDERPSFRLERLTEANGIEHSDAHDALADVRATIAMAKLVKEKQPKLYDYVYKLRDKNRVRQEINLKTRQPVLHVSGKYSPRLGCISLVMPVCQHPQNNNGILIYDLRTDPTEWMAEDVAAIKARIYTPRHELPEGLNRIPVKTLHVNRCPIVTPATVLEPERARQYELDMEQCRKHWQLLMDNSEALDKIREVFQQEPEPEQERKQGDKQTSAGQKEQSDPDYMIYSGGFFPDTDKRHMKTVRSTSPQELSKLNPPFEDPRLGEMLFRYRARNYPDSLNAEEQAEWQAFRRERLLDKQAWQDYQRNRQAAIERASPDRMWIIEELDAYVEALRESLGESPDETSGEIPDETPDETTNESANG
ncbi:MAG: exodeoxyribonuclease I [Pseudohongiellaceae bacterium]